MKIIKIDNTNNKEFYKYYKSKYLNHPLKRDSLSGMLKDLLNGKSELCKSVDLKPLMVINNNKIIMICMLAYAYRIPEFVQIGFFEAEEYNEKAFNMILKEAITWAGEKKATKLSASLNIHVNYGLGFLASDYDKKQSFGAAHNPPFYNVFFEKSHFSSIDMVSYKKDMRHVDELVPVNIMKRVNKTYSVRKANFRDFKKDIEIYTAINNKSFKEHLFYYPRKNEEDFELFKSLKYLLKSENLLFVEKNKEVVGFMLWYPDFNQLMSPSETVGIKTVIKNKLHGKMIDTFKIVEIGVVPEERNKGAILSLFDYCFNCVKDNYDFMESSWILAENYKSKGFGIQWADCESKKYKAYIKELV